MGTLAPLSAVKAKLDIPLSETAVDNAVQAALDAADEYARHQTGYQRDAETSRVDTFLDLRHDDRIFLSRRPVSSVASVTARDAGSATETSLTYDLVDSVKGLVFLVPDAVGYGAAIGPAPSRWPIVTVTYDVAGDYTIPADLADAVAELAAFWFKFDRANAASVGAGPFSEQLITDRAVPLHVQQRLYRYRRKLARLVG